MKSRATVALTLGLLVALVAAGPVYAAPADSVDAHIHLLASGKARYAGVVTSANPDCVSHRKVKVSWRKGRLVKTTTNSKGKFSAVGKTPVSGTKLTLKVAPKGDTCPKLLATSTAS